MIAEGSQFDGALVLLAEGSVYGTVHGEIIQQSRELTRVGRTGWVRGPIVSIGPVYIEGRVDGNVRSESKIILRPTAEVKGELLAPRIGIESGAKLQGSLRRLQPPSSQQDQKAA